LQLRRDARWSNGDPVTAHDFVRAWLRLLRARVDVAYALFPVKGAEAYHRGARDRPEAVGLSAVDNYTLRIELEQPRTSLVAEIADPMLSPLHHSAEKVLEHQTYSDNPASLVTNGPFRLVGSNPDGFRMEANPRYHGRRAVRLAGLEFVRAQNPSLGELLVAAGVADLLPGVSFVPNRRMPTQRPMTVDSELTLGVVALFFNTTRPPLGDIRVRQALALALDRKGLIEETDRQRLVPAWSWVPELLAEAGFPEGRGFPILRMALPLWMEGNPYPAACSERWFKELGVRVYVAYEAPAARHARMAAGDYDVVYGALIATVPDPADLLTIFTMPMEYSETKWRDDETHRLVAMANRKTGAERLALLEAVERRVMAGASAVPVMFERRHTVRAREVRGWYADPLARQSPKHLWLAEPASELAASGP
jgi:oligopeptide transport system substrate-binding protein